MSEPTYPHATDGAARGRLRLLQLYPRDMNIYGDWGNTLVLARRAQWAGYDVDLLSYDPGDELPDDVDLLVGGGGQDSGQERIKADLVDRGPQLRAWAADGVPMLVICGLYQLFGHRFVTGTGADVTYPRSSEDVFARAVTQGAVVSLENWGQTPRRYAFPKRNRIIAALSQSILICEAGLRSGTFSTALAAGQMGRDLYAVPGSIFSPESMGANQLIAEGAHIIASEIDLEQRISLDFGMLRMVGEGVPRQEGRILSALMSEPTRPDDLARYLAEPVTSILVALSDYEGAGMVKRLPDGRYSLSESAYLARDRMVGHHEKERIGRPDQEGNGDAG